MRLRSAAARAAAFRPVSLRSRLVVVVVVLLILGLAVSSLATFTYLRHSEYNKLETTLQAAQNELQRELRNGTVAPTLSSGETAATTYGAFVSATGQTQLVGEDPFGTARQPIEWAPLNGVVSHQTPVPVTSSLAKQAIEAGGATVYATIGASNGPSYRVAASAFLGGVVVVAASLGDLENTLHTLRIIEVIAGIAVLVIGAALARWLVDLGLRPLQDIGSTAAAIAHGDLSRRVTPAETQTEIGRLGLALNGMLSQIELSFTARQASEERLRRFVADAGHELRTPLTSIRGYAELFRRGAANRPDDLALVMRRIESEAARMGILVDDLLLLARLDEGRPLQREPVDLSVIAADAVEDARAVEPDRPIDLATPGPVTVVGDEARLRQVATNLLANVRAHTPLGTPAHVRVSSGEGVGVLEVADEGPGLDAETASRVFERFFRGDPSRRRGESGGSGLGLSIVAAITEAHGGTATVRSADGAGAIFRVELPRQRAVEPGQPDGAPGRLDLGPGPQDLGPGPQDGAHGQPVVVAAVGAIPSGQPHVHSARPGGDEAASGADISQWARPFHPSGPGSGVVMTAGEVNGEDARTASPGAAVPPPGPPEPGVGVREPERDGPIRDAEPLPGG